MTRPIIWICLEKGKRQNLTLIKGFKVVGLLIVLLLCSYEDDGVSTDPQLQHNLALRAENGKDTTFFSLRTPQLHQ